MRQIPLAIGPAPQATFDTFLSGDDGAPALEHLRRLAMPAAPVYLWGPPASGKTHLLRALAHACAEVGQGSGWFDAEHPLPWALAPDWSLVVIDRCELLSPAAQQGAFALFVEAATEGVQVAAAGRLPPVDLPLRDDLRTRLGWGDVFALQPPPEDRTRSALQREAARRGIALGAEVLDHLLTRFPRDLAHLMTLLDRLDGFALARQRPVTVPLLRAMLAEEAAAVQAPASPGAAASTAGADAVGSAS